MSDLEQLIKHVTAQYRWGLHPLKVMIALLLPVLIVWAADWRIRRLSSAADRVGSRRDAGSPAGPRSSVLGD